MNHVSDFFHSQMIKAKNPPSIDEEGDAISNGKKLSNAMSSCSLYKK